MSKKRSAEFEQLAQERRPSLATEFWHFFKHNKKWWLLPVILVLLLLGVIVFLAGTSAAPFIYTLF